MSVTETIPPLSIETRRLRPAGTLAVVLVDKNGVELARRTGPARSSDPDVAHAQLDDVRSNLMRALEDAQD